MITVNAYYSKTLDGVGDRFPAFSWEGKRDAIMKLLEQLVVYGTDATRVEIVFDPSHPSYTVGLNPHRLGDAA